MRYAKDVALGGLSRRIWGSIITNAALYFLPRSPSRQKIAQIGFLAGLGKQVIQALVQLVVAPKGSA